MLNEAWLNGAESHEALWAQENSEVNSSAQQRTPPNKVSIVESFFLPMPVLVLLEYMTQHLKPT